MELIIHERAIALKSTAVDQQYFRMWKKGLLQEHLFKGIEKFAGINEVGGYAPGCMNPVHGFEERIVFSGITAQMEAMLDAVAFFLFVFIEELSDCRIDAEVVFEHGYQDDLLICI